MAQHYPSVSQGARYDTGLREYFLSVFLLMGIGVGITAAVSWWISRDAALMNSLFHLETVVEDGKNVTRPMMSASWLICSLLELVAVWWLASGRVANFGRGMSYIVFAIYAGISGFTLAPALYAYTDASIGTVFVISAAMFLGSALFGHTTKINLRPLGTFFIMGVIGLIVAMLVNFLLQSAAIDYAISVIGVLVFAGLTAFDMQKLEDLYDEMGASEGLAVYGALTLYLNFINMFLFLLRLFGRRGD